MMESSGMRWNTSPPVPFHSILYLTIQTMEHRSIPSHSTPFHFIPPIQTYPNQKQNIQNSAIPLAKTFFCSVILFRSSASAMGGAHALKRVPRIKFPNRHPKSSGSAPETQPLSSSTDANLPFFSSSKASMSLGGKASDQPKRTPVSNGEIEAILLGGCF